MILNKSSKNTLKHSHQPAVISLLIAAIMTISGCATTQSNPAHTSTHSMNAAMPTIDKQGRIAYVEEIGFGAEKVSTLYTIRPDGSERQTITQLKGLLFAPSWAFDGKSLAYSVQLPRSRPDIFIYQFNDGSISKVVDRKGLNLSPSLSPDGSQLLFSSSDAGNSDIYLKSLATDTIQRITTLPSTEVQPSYAADGKSFVYTSDKGRSNIPRIYRYYFATEKAIPIKTKGYAASPQLSLDGSKLGYLNGRYAATMNLMTGQVTNLADTGLDEPARLSPSGLYAVYPIKNNQGKGSLAIRSLASESSYTISSPTDGVIRSPVWSR